MFVGVILNHPITIAEIVEGGSNTLNKCRGHVLQLLA
jgi:hypothetical protein